MVPAAVGAGLVKMGSDLDKAYDTIIIGTGASGEALDGLKEDFAAVAANTPASLDQVGVARPRWHKSPKTV